MTNTTQNTKTIEITIEDILALIRGRKVKRDELVISSNVSFLAVVALLEEEMKKRLAYASSSI